MSDLMPAWLAECTHDPVCDTAADCPDACHACRPEQDCIEHKAQAREGAAYDTADMNRSDR
jgi:hypothetical protein